MGKAVARKKKLKRSVKIAMHKVPMDKSLKKPLSGYMLWFKDARKTIKGKNVAEVGKKAGEMWKSMSADKKKPFLDRVAAAQKTYKAYVATGKGAAALKAYKEGIAKAKAPLMAGDEKKKAKKAAPKRRRWRQKPQRQRRKRRLVPQRQRRKRQLRLKRQRRQKQRRRKKRQKKQAQ